MAGWIRVKAVPDGGGAMRVNSGASKRWEKTAKGPDERKKEGENKVIFR